MSNSGHPMYGIDRQTLNQILPKGLKQLTKQDITDLSRLIIRYQSSNAEGEIVGDITAFLDRIGKTREQLHERSRAIWQSGFRPSQFSEGEVGSGADVEAGCGS